MPRAIVGIGGNLGARRAIFACAEALLAAQSGCCLLARSQLYATPALGPPQPDYLNGAFAIAWDGDAHGLLDMLRHVEQLLGRARRERWGARTVDLDILHWSAAPIATPSLTVPHAELERRTFALAPLLDVAPDLAVTYQAVLEGLGGAPALAVPGWLLLAHASPGAPRSSPAERAAWAQLLVGTVAQCGELT